MNKKAEEKTHVPLVVIVAVVAVVILVILFKGDMGTPTEDLVDQATYWHLCTDSDGNNSYTATAAYAKYKKTPNTKATYTVTYSDSCSDETILVERVCNGYTPSTAMHKCANGCASGACKIPDEFAEPNNFVYGITAADCSSAGGVFSQGRSAYICYLPGTWSIGYDTPTTGCSAKKGVIGSGTNEGATDRCHLPGIWDFVYVASNNDCTSKGGVIGRAASGSSGCYFLRVPTA